MKEEIDKIRNGEYVPNSDIGNILNQMWHEGQEIKQEIENLKVELINTLKLIKKINKD